MQKYTGRRAGNKNRGAPTRRHRRTWTFRLALKMYVRTRQLASTAHNKNEVVVPRFSSPNPRADRNTQRLDRARSGARPEHRRASQQRTWSTRFPCSSARRGRMLRRSPARCGGQWGTGSHLRVMHASERASEPIAPKHGTRGGQVTARRMDVARIGLRTRAQKSLKPRNTLYTWPSEPQPDRKRI